MTRDERQELFINKFKLNKGRGTLLGATGFGKTYVSLLIMKKMLAKNNKSSTLVVVPTINLKEQWEYKIEQLNIKNCRVLVINTAVSLKKTFKCDLLVLDEIHMYGGDIFSLVFKIKHKYILGLSATIEQNSNVGRLINVYCPIIDEISLNDCKDNGWVADFIVYNLPISLTDKEKNQYNSAEYVYRRSEKELGGKLTAFNRSNEWKKSDSFERKKVAYLYWSSMQKRKKILVEASNKVLMTKKIIEMFPDRKALVFSESIDLAIKVKESIGKTCALYHSKLKKDEKSIILEKFSKTDEIKVVSSVKALNAGADIPDCSLGIVTSGNSKSIDDIQRTGRVARKHGDKKSIFINLYIPNTQDEVWLKKRQVSIVPKIIHSLEEIQ